MVRDDRLGRLQTALPRQALHPDDGWCDDPADPAYNQPVRHPYPASAERLWRDDRVYDAILVLGYNDDPPQPARGSAIFLHAARSDFSATEGCVALAIDELVRLIGLAVPGDAVEILKA
jgi:L,D-peptidoglycan transpeptidase YkuD (ErfK/YbiS/YcfS/YnhG family)